MKYLRAKPKANLDAYITNISKFSYDAYKEGKIKMGEEMKEMKNSFIKDFSKVFPMNKTVDIFDILDIIKMNLKIKTGNIYFHAKCKFSQYYFCPPHKRYILLYKMKNKEDFISVIIKKRIVTFIQVSSGKEFNKIFDKLYLDFNYYYCLKIIKQYKAKRLKPDTKIDNKEIKNGKIPNIRNIYD